MNKENTELTDLFGEVISSYSRKEAIEDGILCEVPAELQKDAGFKYPIALSSGVYAIIEQAIEKSKEMNDFEGIVWDILTILKYNIARSKDPQRVDFEVIIWRQHYKMYSICGAGDNGEPVITIMLPNED
jgi:hypothetical protein